MSRKWSLSFFFLFTYLSISASTFAEDWPQWLGSKRDGKWREDGILEKFPTTNGKKELKQLWKTTIGSGYAGPAVAGGKVFVADRLVDGQNNLDKSGFSRTRVNGKERLLCLKEQTGEIIWKHEYPCSYSVQYSSGPRCTPTVDTSPNANHVYHLGAMGDLICLEVATGKVVWQKNLVKDFEAVVPIWGFASHPLIEGNQLICIVGGSEGRFVMSLDKLTGKELWRAGSYSGDCGYCSPVICSFGKNRQLITWLPKAILGLDIESGKILWENPWEIKASLTAPLPQHVGKNELFISSFYNGSRLLKIDDSGTKAEIVWKSKAKGLDRDVMPDSTSDLHSIMASPVIQNEYVYGVCSYGELRCLKVKTGERVWMTRAPITGKADRWGNLFLTPHHDRYFLFNELGELIIAKLSPEQYTEIDRVKIIKPSNRMAGRPVVWTHPAFANKNIYIRNDNEIICYSLAK